jgi:hypothetical protein
MAMKVMDRWMPSTVAELRDALSEMMGLAMTEAGAEGQDMPDPGVVYVDVREFALVRETLTDGSFAFNVVVRENR